MKPRANATVAALALLYAAQGVPYGFASEYLPVALRQEHYSMGAIAALGWLQLPWQLKFLCAHLADRPAVSPYARRLLLALQCGLFVTMTGFAWRSLHDSPGLWFALTFVAALFASTQDIFVDAIAVRSLTSAQRGFGNTAQVAGYRLGMLVGGAGLLLLIAPLGSRFAVLACASVVLVTGAAAFALRDSAPPDRADRPAAVRRSEATKLVRHMFGKRAWPVVAVALTYKLGLHMAAFLIKPMVVDAHWTPQEIGAVVVTAGTTAGLAGAVAGGALHRWAAESRALAFAALLQSLVCLPLLLAHWTGAPRGLTTAAIVGEHFVTGAGTTVLFAALMSATRTRNAALHYTLLTSANSLAIGVGSTLGGLLADHLGKSAVLAIAAVVGALPLGLLGRWSAAAAASAENSED